MLYPYLKLFLPLDKLDCLVAYCEQQEQTEWERIRWQTTLLLNVHTAKGKSLKPKDLIEFPWENPIKKETNRSLTNNDKYFIRVEQMYEYVLFKKPFTVLSGLLEIAKILGCENGDEYMRSHSDGCETCGDYGSSYRVEWCFW